MAFIDQFNLSQDTTFKSRVQAALVFQAVYTVNSSASNAYQYQQLQYAKQVLSNAALEASNMVSAVAADGGVQTAYLSTTPPDQSNVNDAVVQSAVGTAFQSHAIVTYS